MWFTCSFEGEEEWCDFSETELLALPVPGQEGRAGKEGRLPEGFDFNSRRGDAFTHKKPGQCLRKSERICAGMPGIISREDGWRSAMEKQ